MLQLNQVSVRFGNFQALQNINVNVKAGEVITIVGHNGAGKSTLFNTLCGKTLPSEGSIHLNDIDVSMWGEQQRAPYISCLFQNPLLGSVSTMSVAENLALALYKGKRANLQNGIKKFPEKVIEETLIPLNLGLEKHLNTPIGKLSGGQRQIIAFIMATLVTPQLLLLDEPTAALDPSSTYKLIQLATDYIQEKKISSILVTHDLDQALQFGNRLWILSRGQIKKELGEEKKLLKHEDLLNLMQEADLQ